MAAISRAGCAGFLVIEDDFIATTPCLLDPMRAAGKALPHPAANHRAGEADASLATGLGLDAKPIKAGALYGPECSACVFASAAVRAMRVAMRCLSAACGKILRRKKLNRAWPLN
jgi:hypothetical protein